MKIQRVETTIRSLDLLVADSIEYHEGYIVATIKRAKDERQVKLRMSNIHFIAEEKKHVNISYYRRSVSGGFSISSIKEVERGGKRCVLVQPCDDNGAPAGPKIIMLKSSLRIVNETQQRR